VPIDTVGGRVTLRNVLLLAAALLFVCAFIAVGDGCQGYVSEDNVNFVCNDNTSGVAPLVAGVARWLFAGLVVLATALLDHGALRGASNKPTEGSADKVG
jgi:di/tricarboxylate transporter